MRILQAVLQKEFFMQPAVQCLQHQNITSCSRYVTCCNLLPSCTLSEIEDIYVHTFPATSFTVKFLCKARCGTSDVKTCAFFFATCVQWYCIASCEKNDLCKS